jgi:short-subunit dehydrogenase
MEVRGAKILVTGASSGIGAALARRLAREGATVGIVARRAARLEEVLADCREHAPESAMWPADLGDLATAESVALQAWDTFGHLDAVVHNAGIPKRRHVTQLTPDEVEHVMRVNFLAPARMTLALLPRMLERGSGWIVNVSSVAGRLGNANESAYSASKFALCGWSEAIAVDLWDTGIKVRLVNPGPIDTEIWDLPGEDAPLFEIDKFPADDVAKGIIAAFADDAGFEHYLPDMKAFVDMKQDNVDSFLEGMATAIRGMRSSGGGTHE